MVGRTWVQWAVVSAVVLGMSGCSRHEQLQDTFYPMGGVPFSIKVYDVPQALFEEAFRNVRTEVERLEELFSVYIPDSDVARLNREGRASIAPETAVVLKLALELGSKTDGAFDVTIMPLVQWWKYCEGDGPHGRLPTYEELAARMEQVDWRQLQLSGDRAEFKKAGMGLDLGGIAKGFMADRAAQILKKAGLKRGIISAGGDLVVFNSVGEAPFQVGIRDPMAPERNMGTLAIDNGAIVTSGCYRTGNDERFYAIGSKRYCHILDPKTGWPVKGLLSSTIVAEEAVTADAIATASMVLGREKGLELINMLPGVEGVLVWEEEGKHRWEITEGLKGKVRMEPVESTK